LLIPPCGELITLAAIAVGKLAVSFDLLAEGFAREGRAIPRACPRSPSWRTDGA